MSVRLLAKESVSSQCRKEFRHNLKLQIRLFIGLRIFAMKTMSDWRKLGRNIFLAFAHSGWIEESGVSHCLIWHFLLHSGPFTLLMIPEVQFTNGGPALLKAMAIPLERAWPLLWLWPGVCLLCWIYGYTYLQNSGSILKSTQTNYIHWFQKRPAFNSWSFYMDSYWWYWIIKMNSSSDFGPIVSLILIYSVFHFIISHGIWAFVSIMLQF